MEWLDWLWSKTLCRLGVHRHVIARIDFPYVYRQCWCCKGARTWDRFGHLFYGGKLDNHWVKTGEWGPAFLPAGVETAGTPPGPP